MTKKIIILTVLGIVLLLISGLLVYQEYAPEDQSAATGKTYYLAPSGSDDSGDGSSAKPWKTVTKANSVVQAGDTVIFKDGTYPIKMTELTDGVRITKSGTTWKAENQHKAVIDGGLGPELFQGRGVQAAGTVYREKLPNAKAGNQYHNMVTLVDVSNMTIDGLVFVNSPARALTLKQASPEKTVENIVIKNCWFDFNWGHVFLAEPYVHSDQSKMKNIVGDNNVVTRASILMWAYQYGDRSFFTHWPGPWRPAGSENIVTRNSLFAFGQGEIGAGFGVTNHLFENNTVIHSFIGHYMDENRNVTIRNNLFVSDGELQKNPKPGMGIPSGKGGIVSTRESSIQGVPEDFDNGNFSIYNNVLVGVGIDFSGAFPNWWAPGHPLVYRDTKNIYVGHNTFVVTSTTKPWCSEERQAVCFPQFEYPKNKATGIFENNLFITEQLGSNRAGLFTIPSDNRAWEMSARKNVVPSGSQGTAPLMYADAVVSDNSGVINPNAEFRVDVPNMLTTNREEIKTNALNNEVKAKAYVNNLKLKADSPARDQGSTGGAAKGVTPPVEARTRDFYGNTRDSKPDIGAIEFGGVQTTAQVTPTNSSVPNPSPTPTQPTATGSLTPMPTNTGAPVGSSTPSATTPQGNICGKADSDGNGVFTIEDFSGFARAYGSGKNTCADKDVDYGPCGGRDVNRDGVLNIFDFGGPGVGFAQRYYPKSSCAL